MTVCVAEAHNSDAAIWDSYLIAHQAPPSACWAWRDIMTTSYSVPCTYLLARSSSGEIAGILALYANRDWRARLRFYSLRHGFIANDEETAVRLAEAATALARQRGATSLIVTSGPATFELGCRHWSKARVLLPLCGNSDDMWKALRVMARRKVRKAERSGLTCVQGTEHLRSFYSSYEDRFGAKNVPLHSLRFFKSLLSHSDSILYTALLDNKPVGGMIFQHGTSVPSYFHSSFSPEAAALGVGQFLMWNAVQESIARHATAVDLGESEPGGGAYTFKILFGGVPEEVHYYDLLRSRASSDHISTARQSRTGGLERIVAALPFAFRKPALRIQRRLGRPV